MATALVVSAFSFGPKQMPSLPPAFVKLGVVTAGLGLAYLAFKEIRIACRSMPDEHCDSHGGEVVAKVLQAHGVKHIFTLIGGHISPILVASKKLGITVVDFRHEVNAVFAAVTAGPGVTNTITAVKNAQMAQSPLVLIGGAAPTILKVPLAIYLHHLLHSNAALGPRLSAGCGSAFHSSFLVQVQRLSQQLA